MFAQIQKLYARTQNLLLYALIIGALVFFVEFAPAILAILGDSSQTPNDYAQKTISHSIGSGLSRLSDLSHAQDAITALFWAFCALGLYLGYLFVANSIISARNEIEVDSANPEGSISSTIAHRVGKKILWAITYILFVVVSVAYLIPYWMSLYKIYVYSGMALHNIAYVIGGSIGLVFNVYLLLASTKLLREYEESV